MALLTLIVKGDRAAAIDAATRRAIPIVNVIAEREDWDETIITCDAEHRQRVAMTWFASPPHEAPFPSGTLLWYGDRETAPAAYAALDECYAIVRALLATKDHPHPKRDALKPGIGCLIKTYGLRAVCEDLVEAIWDSAGDSARGKQDRVLARIASAIGNAVHCKVEGWPT